LKNEIDAKNQVTTKEASIEQLEEKISKMEANWASSNAIKNPESEENPENDICYD
jgi:hypothetical protein